MYILNKQEDVSLYQYMNGSVTYSYDTCPTCHQHTSKMVSGEPRCQAVVLTKRSCINVGAERFYGTFNFYAQCHCKASKQVNDVWYCGIHSKKHKTGDEK